MKLGALTFDAADPQSLAAFWANLLQRQPRPAHVLPDVWVVDPTPGETPWLFLPVPESKTAKNRCHPDLHTADLDVDVARAVELGAAVVETHDAIGRWVVLRDPEGNAFCLVQDDDVADVEAPS